MGRYIKKLVVIIFGSVLFCSCLKSKDNTANGPKSLVAITNYVVNGSIGITLDNTTVTTSPLGFGNSVSATSGYLPYGSGLHDIKLSSGTNLSTDNTIALASNIHYSLFLFDTLQNNKVKTLLLKDDLTTVDTVALIRFLQFIPELDSLTIQLKKDTTYSISEAYIGNKLNTETGYPFSLSVVPGNYQVTLFRNGSSIYTQSSLTLAAGKLYSVISKGIVNGTGDYKEAVSVVQNN